MNVRWDAFGWTVTTVIIEYNDVTTTTYTRYYYIINKWNSNIQIKLLLILLYTT